MSTTQPIRDTKKLQNFKSYYKGKRPNARNYCLCILGLNTALRISDVLQLRWDELYNFEQEAWLSHVCVTEQKTGKTNRIALNGPLKKALQDYFTYGSSIPKTGDYLFQSRKGKNQPLTRVQAFRIIREAACETGLQHISCHSLRKTFGYHAWKQGVHPALIMDIYNHSSYQVTKHYLGIDQDDRDKVFKNISL